MFEWIGKVIAGAIALFLSVILGGIVTKDLWLWFFVETFNLPELSIASAIGISLVIGWIAKNPYKPEDEGFWHILLESLIRTLSAWGVGWIIYQFV